MIVIRDALDVEERRGVTLDFTDEVGDDTLDGVDITVRTLQGLHTSPAEILDGLPSISGKLVIIPLQGVVGFCDYNLRVKVTTAGGSRLVVSLLLRVRKL